MKVSLITTLFNESKFLEPLFVSILSQAHKPDEFVVVDGGSTDGTWEKIKEWTKEFKKTGIKFKAIQEKGNIAHGRNTAIKNASHSLIASIDGGCIADKNWLKNLLAKYSKGVVVSGNFKPLATNFQERVQAVFVRPSAEDNPSSRSILFEKAAWEQVGGYPEHLYTGEDTLFNARLKEAGYIFKFAKDAVVYWRMRPSLWKWLKQYYLYGYGDGQAKNLNLHTNYGKKLTALFTLTYLLIFFTLLVRSIILPLFILSVAIGLKKSFSLEGFVAGLLLPFRYIFFIIGFHKGILSHNNGF